MPKSDPAFFVGEPLEAGALVRLPASELRHVRARRLRTGSAVRLSDGEGRRGKGTVRRLSRTECTIAVEAVDAAVPQEPRMRVHLFVPAIRLPRLSWLVEKATELGASRVTLVASERTQTERAEEAARGGPRLSRVIREAAKQSGQGNLPALAGPIGFDAMLSAAATHPAALLLDPAGGIFPPALSPPVALGVGPEGGWSPAEIVAAERAGWRRTRLPGAVLRAETAALAALILALRSIDTADPVGGQ